MPVMPTLHLFLLICFICFCVGKAFQFSKRAFPTKQTFLCCNKLESSKSKDCDLLIVGAGYLGEIIGTLWLKSGDSKRVFAETRSNRKHNVLSGKGMQPLLRAERNQHPFNQWHNIVFCASPSGNDNYVGELEEAVKLWSGDGNFVFTSSTGIFAEDSGGVVTSSSPLGNNPRSQKLFQAEQVALKAGGTVVRLAGLYDTERGAHNYWLGLTELNAHSQGIINLLHYEDAASVVLAVLNQNKRGQVFMAADGFPMTRLQICEAALKASIYKEGKLPVFLQNSIEFDGKILDVTETFASLNWLPKYASFEDYMGKK